MNRLPERIVAIAMLVAVAAFAFLNAGQRVTVDLGFHVFHHVRLTIVVYGALLLGMLAMFVLGLRHDLRVRRLLREQLERDEH